MGLVRDRSVPAPRRAGSSIDSLESADRRDAVRGMPHTPEAAIALADHLETEADASVRQLILTTLAARQTPEIVRALLPFLASDDAALRTAVAETLAAMPDAVASEIPGLMSSPDHDVRIMTVMLLGQLPHPDVTGWLCVAANEDPHPNVVGCALSELVRLGPAPFVEVFQVATKRFPDDPFIAFVAGAIREEQSA